VIEIEHEIHTFIVTAITRREKKRKKKEKERRERTLDRGRPVSRECARSPREESLFIYLSLSLALSFGGTPALAVS